MLQTLVHIFTKYWRMQIRRKWYIYYPLYYYTITYRAIMALSSVRLLPYPCRPNAVSVCRLWSVECGHNEVRFFCGMALVNVNLFRKLCGNSGGRHVGCLCFGFIVLQMFINLDQYFCFLRQSWAMECVKIFNSEVLLCSESCRISCWPLTGNLVMLTLLGGSKNRNPRNPPKFTKSSVY